MREALQDLERHLDRPVRRPASAQVRHETEAARVVLVPRVVQAARGERRDIRGGQRHEFSNIRIIDAMR
jgi:hypothetical protein